MIKISNIFTTLRILSWKSLFKNWKFLFLKRTWNFVIPWIIFLNNFCNTSTTNNLLLFDNFNNDLCVPQLDHPGSPSTAYLLYAYLLCRIRRIKLGYKLARISLLFLNFYLFCLFHFKSLLKQSLSFPKYQSKF